MTTRTVRTTETSPQVYARVAGFLYLVLGGLLSPFGLLYIPSALVVPGDAAATIAKIMASETLVRLSIVSALLSQIVFILVALALYQLLKSVHKNMARLMVILLLLGVPIAMLNELNHIAVLFLVSDVGRAAFTVDQLHGLVPLFLNLHAFGLDIVDIFWGLWLFPMGYLVFQSGFLPRAIGVLLMFGCVGYLLQAFASILIPTLTVDLAMLTAWVEILLPLWLLFKGVNVDRWQQRTLVVAASV
jgi:hypothetical protein